MLERTPSRARRNCYCNAKCQLNFEYKNGKRNGAKTTEVAHQTLREKGHYKRDNSYIATMNKNNIEKRKKSSEAMMGEKNPMFGRGGLLNPNYRGGYKRWSGYRGFNWRGIRTIAKQRDNFTCKRCGITEQDSILLYKTQLQVDHIVPYRISKDSSLSNLQTLCCKCHGKKQREEYTMYFNPNCRCSIVPVF